MPARHELVEEPLVRLREVTHRHGPQWSLTVPSLEIRSNEIVCLLGPTGAGKSTLLRLLSGLERPQRGEIVACEAGDESPVVPLSPHGSTTMVFQNPLLLTGTVRQNVEYGLRVRGQSHRRPISDGILEQLGIRTLASRPVRTLSGGQRQLVALARAMAIEPRLLLLDEPTAHLDPATVAVIESVIVGRNRSPGMTVIWATHNLFQARRVAHRTGLILNGELVELCATREFFEAPSDGRTAAFVRGEMVY